jgi:putative phosphoribosyl transferase
MFFLDRTDAGQRLAQRLMAYRDADATVVLGIPRGGLVVAHEVARALRLPLGICAVRKVGAPENPELAIGAVDDEDGLVLDRRLARHLGLGADQLERAAAVARAELRAWLRTVAGHAPPVAQDREVILVDDGVATGYTAQVGVEALRRHGARRIVLAEPVAPPDTAAWLCRLVDEWVCLQTPEPFHAVGEFFEEWRQVTDEEVQALLPAGNSL